MSMYYVFQYVSGFFKSTIQGSGGTESGAMHIVDREGNAVPVQQQQQQTFLPLWTPDSIFHLC